MNRGKLAVGSMLLVGVLLAGFALWWNVTGGRRTLEFWGPSAAQRIIDEQARVELLWLRPSADGAVQELLTIGTQTYAIVATEEVTGARGLVHARHSLLEDASFEWDEIDSHQSAYEVAVRFSDESGVTTAAFAFSHPRIAHVETGRSQPAAGKIVAGWKQFAQRHAPRETRIGQPNGAGVP